MVETSVILPPDYKPSADEEYMNEMQVEYFRQNCLIGKNLFLHSLRTRWRNCVRAV